MTEEDLLHEKAKQRAFRLLAMRPLSEKELRSKLKERGFDESVVETVTARLRELQYLNDESFARQWAHNLAVNRLFGNKRIEASLREKGVTRALTEQVITEVRQEMSEREAIRALIGKKKEKTSIIMDEKEKRRFARRLMGKGFPLDLIFDMLITSKEEYIDEGE
ncbi:MAG: RecX family transcriptional regulator [Syntrophaceae bacterium]